MNGLGVMPPSVYNENCNRSQVVHRSPDSILNYDIMMLSARKRANRKNMSLDDKI